MDGWMGRRAGAAKKGAVCARSGAVRKAKAPITTTKTGGGYDRFPIIPIHSHTELILPSFFRSLSSVSLFFGSSSCVIIFPFVTFAHRFAHLSVSASVIHTARTQGSDR